MDHIVIIGAGTFGLSTALHLLRGGQTNVTLVDPYPIPSPLSAGNDVNKILQSSASKPFYAELALEAMELWRNDPVFLPAFHETGIIYATASDYSELEPGKTFLKAKKIPFEELNTPADFSRKVPSPFDDEDSRWPKWKGYYQKERCGWTYAVKALELAAAECTKLGAKFVVDQAAEILYNDKGAVTGVRTYSGTILTADKVVIAAGAASYKLLEFHGQLLAKCWTVGHIRLSEEEAKVLKDSPVVISYDHGFFFEPDSNNDVKFCNEFPGYINLQGKDSVPVYRNQVPVEAEKYMRLFLKEAFPTMANKSFSVAKICWCTDTTDRHFLIGTHPEHPGLILGTGDSGQGFKFMPNVGKYIADVVVEGDAALPEDKREAWKWRPEQAATRDIYDLQMRSGGTNLIKDLKDVDQWTDGRNGLEGLSLN